MEYNLELLKEVLSIPSYSRREELVRDFVISYAKERGYEVIVDDKRNVYVTNGEIDEGEYYPCVVAHMDTVHRSHTDLIDENRRLIIESSTYNENEQEEFSTLIAKHPDTNKQTGIGGDDKCGVYACLELLTQGKMKAAFFVEEEIGMLGSKEANELFFKDVGYAIQFDAPSDNWITEVCSGVRIMDDEFKELITENLDSNGYRNFSRDPFTDVNQLSKKFDFNCVNLGCGYHRQHTDSEYVVVNEVFNSVTAGLSLINHLGNKKYAIKKDEVITESNYPYQQYQYDDSFDYNNMDYYMESDAREIVEVILMMKSLGKTKEEIVDMTKKILFDIVSY
jgi:di/tripeptidase